MVSLDFLQFLLYKQSRSSSTSLLALQRTKGDRLMKETQKIALACFIGGALGAFVTLLVSPTLWWFGMLAGFAGGYVSYEFKQVRQAIPVAWKAAGGIRMEFVGEIKAFFSQKHPFLYPALVLVVWPTQHIMILPTPSEWNFTTGVVAICFAAFLYCLSAMFMAYILAGLAFVGSRFGEGCYFYPFFLPQYNLKELLQSVRHVKKEGLRREPATYRNVARWVAKGITFSVYVLIVVILYLFGHLVEFLWRFLVNLFKLIHSDKRLLCGTDAALGVAVSYTWLTSLGNPFVMVIGGGLIGAALGILNWELVSKRWLGVAEA